MKRLVFVLALGSAVSVLAVGDFLSSLPPETFAAAGLGKLTPEELARLEQIVAERERSAAKVAVAAVEPEVSAKSETKATGPGWLRALVTLQETSERPDVAEAVESRLEGDYEGWTGKTVFKLENGQVWQQTSGGERVDDKRRTPVVKIYPGMMGAYWLEVEGVRERVKVRPVKLK